MPYLRTDTELGRGGFAVVYQAIDKKTNQPFAWKEIIPSKLTGPDKKRFSREVKIQLVLSHKHIVNILAARVDAEPFVIVMPIALGSLRARFSKVFGDSELVQKIFRQICEGVHHAHTNGVIHRDLKPENILFFEEELVRVSDFGLAKRVDAESIAVTKTGEYGGSLPYAAPEQYLAFKDVDLRADIFSLGKILYELYTGNLPLTLHLTHASLPKAIRYIIQKACEPDPPARYQTVSDLLEDYLLATGQRKALTNPEQVINDLLKRLMDGDSITDTFVQQIDELFSSQSGDAAFYMKHFVELPQPLLLKYFLIKRQGFEARLEEFDEHISGGLPFSYTDTAADFYSGIFDVVPDQSIQILLLRRMFEMGHAHNRWYVREVFCRCIRSLTDDATILAVRDLIRSDPDAAKWHKDTCCEGGLHHILKAEFSKHAPED